MGQMQVSSVVSIIFLKTVPTNVMNLPPDAFGYGVSLVSSNLELLWSNGRTALFLPEAPGEKPPSGLGRTQFYAAAISLLPLERGEGVLQLLEATCISCLVAPCLHLQS